MSIGSNARFHLNMDHFLLFDVKFMFEEELDKYELEDNNGMHQGTCLIEMKKDLYSVIMSFVIKCKLQ